MVHAPGGPVWLRAGQEVPAGLQVRADLLLSDPPPAKVAKPKREQAAPTEPPTPEVVEEAERSPIPQVSYPTEKWVEYAESLGLTDFGSKRVEVIRAVASHFGVTVKSRRPADIVAAIVEATTN